MTRTKPSRIAILSTLVAATFLAMPMVSASADPEPDPAAQDTAVLSQAQTDLLESVATAHSALGVFDGASTPVVVLPAGASTDQKAKAVADVPLGTNAEVTISQFTKDALDTLQKVVSDRKWNAEAGKYGAGTYYDAKQDKVIVQTDAPASVTDSLLDAHPGEIELQPARFEAQSSTRYNATSPFYGGAALTNGRGKCTSGVTVKSVFTGVRELTTAAHCYPVLDTIYNRHTNDTTGAWMGYVNRRDTQLDVEFLRDAGYDSFLHSGGWERSTSSVFVHAATYARLNMKVCVSGSVSFNHCGHPIVNGSYSVRWTGSDAGIDGGNGFLYDRGGNGNQGPLTQGGDSGAPIFVTDSTGSAAFIAGLHTGLVWTWDGNVCHCSTPKMVGVKIGPVLQSHSLDLVTR